MDLIEATRMVLAESAAFPDLMRVSREAYDQASAGRQVDHTALSWMLKEAARKNLYGALIHKHGKDGFDAMVTVLCREIDRQAPVAAR